MRIGSEKQNPGTKPERRSEKKTQRIFRSRNLKKDSLNKYRGANGTLGIANG